MIYLTMFIETFNQIFNSLVRDVSPAVKATVALIFFGFALYFFAKCIKKKEGGIPFKLGFLVLAILCAGVTCVYTFL